jgi:hypothetical protein
MLGPGIFFGFLIVYIDGRTPWMRDQPVVRSLATQRTIQAQNIRTHTHTHPCLDWDSNP